MDWWQALVIGLVEGLTEYLPVSSTGHIILAQRWMGIEDGPAANAFAIAVQAGAIAAVLGLYRTRVVQMLRGLRGLLRVGEGDAAGQAIGLAMVVAFLPAAVLGPLFDDAIEERLFHRGRIAAALFVGGVGILVASFFYRRRAAAGEVAPGRDLESLGLKAALLIGLMQCLAMWPGTSRSLVTIVGGLVVGLNMAAAVEFSFLLGLLTLGAATAYKSVSDGAVMLEHYGPGSLLIGFLVAWLSAVVSVRWMVSWLKSHGLAVFGWYRVVLACLVYIFFV
jgi:undecaprenyl-diphosphatase